MMNIATIYAFRKVSSLPQTLKTLLLSLAVSDVGVGLLGQPLYILTLIKWLQQNPPSCYIYRLLDLASILFAEASFLGVVVVSVDRFLALHLHLRYQELVTHRRVVVAVISVWILRAFFSFLAFSGFVFIQGVISYVVGFIGLFITTVIYIQIYVIVRRYNNQIQALQVQQQTEEAMNFASVIKSAVCVLCVHVVFLCCYLLPFLLSVASILIVPGIAFKKCFLYSLTLTFLNSSLNPVVFCWKMGHIRHAIMDLLQNIARNRNQAS